MLNLNIFGRFYGEGEGTVTPPVPPVVPPTGKIEFTPEQQAKVNELLATNKRELQKRVEDLQKSVGDTNALTSKLKELGDQLLTKEELAKQEQERLKTEYDTGLQTATQKAADWENRYKETVFDVELGKAAQKHDAFDPFQLGALVKGQSQVVEDLDSNGKGTGKFKVLTKVNVEGKELTLPIDEAIGKLRVAGQYPNQFKVKGSPGTGTTLNNSPIVPGTDGSVPTDPSKFMEYFANLRKTGKI
jgi:hypothetical protein